MFTLSCTTYGAIVGLTHSQKANFLSSVGEKTPIFIRFSTVTVGREYPDEARNPRGFAIKFYTMEGNYDIVGLNFVSTMPCIG
jgi:catalase